MSLITRVSGIFVLAVVSAALAGCGDDDGTTAGMDAGVDAGTGDGGGVVGDGGTPQDAGFDGAVAPVDAGSFDAGPPFDAGPDDFCTMPSDCVWGEIDHDILRAEDCICLFGCPSLPQSAATRDRRAAQYADKCTPGVDGMGHPCPVDDCIMPPPLTCEASRCVLAPDGGAG